MSAISVILLLALFATGIAVGLAVGVWRALRWLRREVSALRSELAASAPGAPGPRAVPDEEIVRAAVADALAEERERELAEARAFWAEQEARDAGGSGTPLLAGRGTEYEVAEAAADGGADEALDQLARFDTALVDALWEGYPPPGGDDEGGDGPTVAGDRAPRADVDGVGRDTREGVQEPDACDSTGESDRDRPSGGVAFVPRQGPADRAPGQGPGEDGESTELAAARRRHPSHPGYTLTGEPVRRGGASAAEERHRTTQRLARLSEERTPLADVRPGPVGTLDVYLFEDGTTLCLSPGHQQTAQRLAAAVRDGEAPVLMGGSGVSGAYALTFACGDDTVYLLADRVVAS